MKILMCASEVAPFAKTGGLADVVGALPIELARLGHDVRVVTPLHGTIDRAQIELTPLPNNPLGVPVGFSEEWCAVFESRLPSSDVPVYFLEHNRYWDRPAIYQWNGRDYDDNAERFAFLARAACQLCKFLGWPPDVLHSHDWQGGLIPMLLKTIYSSDRTLGAAASVMTIHNVGYQGDFPKEQIVFSQLGWEWFTPAGLEFYDKINYLKAGVLFAEKVSTVSPTYAREITTPEGGFALDGVLRSRAPDLVGVLNGLDYNEWNPAEDSFLAACFDADAMAGKAACKAEVQREFGLPVRSEVPLVVMVTRLAYQKGMDVLAAALPAMMRMDLQFIVLGSGEIWAHFVYGDLANRFPGKAAAFIGFDNGKAHRVYAGGDFFLMPSRYEPCGLGQMSAMRYAALPIVRATGGLRDTVEGYAEGTGDGDGFAFNDLTPLAIANTVAWAVSTWYDRPEHIPRMRRRAMGQRFCWSDSAKRYVELYQWALERRRT